MTLSNSVGPWCSKSLMHMPSSEWWQWSPQQPSSGTHWQPPTAWAPSSTGRSRSLTALLISQPCWDPGSTGCVMGHYPAALCHCLLDRWVESIIWAPLKNSICVLTAPAPLMPVQGAEPAQSWKFPAKGISASLPSKPIPASTKAAARWGGGQEGEKRGSRNWLLEQTLSGGFSCSIPSPATWGRGDVLAVVTCWKHSHSLWIHILNLKRLLFALRPCKGTGGTASHGAGSPCWRGHDEELLRRTNILHYVQCFCTDHKLSFTICSRDTALSWFSPRGSVCTCHAWTNSWLYKLFRSPFISTFHSWKYISPSNTKCWAIGCCLKVWNHLDQLSLSNQLNTLCWVFWCSRKGTEKSSNRKKLGESPANACPRPSRNNKLCNGINVTDSADVNVAHGKN